jgi:hypothetical protein
MGINPSTGKFSMAVPGDLCRVSDGFLQIGLKTITFTLPLESNGELWT